MKNFIIMLIAFFAVFLQPPQAKASALPTLQYVTQDLPSNLAAVIFVLSFGVEKDYYSYSNRYSCSLLDETYTNLSRKNKDFSTYGLVHRS